MEGINVIRDFCNNDLNDLIRLLQQGYLISTEEATEEFTGTNRKIFVYEEGSIKGFALVTVDNEETKTCKLRIYVGKPFRYHGIGKKLHEEAFKCAKKDFGAKTIAIGFTCGKNDPTTFYKNLYYTKWFIYHDMKYFGKSQPDINLPFINYEDKYFENYETLQGQAFFDLRRANDIKPYNCSDFSEKMRQNLMKNKQYIYLLLDDEDEIISAITLKNGIIDGVMVNKKYEGQGYGCKTTQFGINKFLNEGFKDIELCALDWNKRALHIYEALGFKVVQTFHNYRQPVK